MLPSLARILVGFGLAAVIGVIGGILLGLLPRFEEAVRPLLEFLRSTPGVALLPIAIMFLGIGDGMKVFMIALASMWPILLNTIDGVRSVEPVLLRVARSYRLTLADRIRFIYIPNAAPQIFAGARLSLAIAAVVMVVTEMIGIPRRHRLLHPRLPTHLQNPGHVVGHRDARRVGLPAQSRIPPGRGPGPRLAQQEKRLGA